MIKTNTKYLFGIFFLALLSIQTAPSASGQDANPAPARSCNLPEPIPCPLARIVELSIEPSIIEPGESARITWASENPVNMTMSSGIGRITARGTIEVKPAATTTYTIRSDGGLNGEEVRRSITLTVRGTEPVIEDTLQETDELPPIPRMANDKPDLQGVWFGGWWYLGNQDLDNGGLPQAPTPKPGFEDLAIVDDPLEVGEGCAITSVPWYFGPVYHFQIVQTADTIVLMTERMHLYRIVEMDKEHSADVMNGESLTYLGSSVGSWDGDTLVIDTRGFNLETHVGKEEAAYIGGYRHSKNLHMVERIRRLDYNTLEIETTLEDPELFEGPWRIVNHHELRPEFSRVPEYICEQDEGFYDSVLNGLEEVPKPFWLEVSPTTEVH